MTKDNLVQVEKGKRFAGVRLHAGGERSESSLDSRQPAKKPPGQAGVVGEDDAASLGNHGGYIVDWNGSDNEMARRAANKQKGPNAGPLKQS